MHVRRLVLALAAGALALAGCGTTATVAARGASAHSAFLDFSKCMRTHGVANFPDPSPGSGGIHIDASSGLDPRAPAFGAAQRACRHLLPGGGPPTSLPEGAKESALRFAQCMRAHGVSNFPDPIFRGEGVMEQVPSGREASSPAFQSAQQACGGLR
jgi:hypothetical protein